MTTKDEALKLALEAMEGACGSYNVPLTAQVCEAIEACRAALAEPVQDIRQTILEITEAYRGTRYGKAAERIGDAIQAALAQPKQEPVAWMFEYPDKRVAPKFDSAPHGGNWKPLYTIPQPAPAVQQESADDKVICPSCTHQFRAIPFNVQKLMLGAGFEPPFTEAPAVEADWEALSKWWESGDENFPNLKRIVMNMLAAAQPAPAVQPMTPEQVEMLFGKQPTKKVLFTVRAVEKHHGIGAPKE